MNDPNHPPPHLQQHPPPTIVYVQSQAPTKRKGPHHMLHAILTLFTGGLWIPIWLLITMVSRRGD